MTYQEKVKKIYEDMGTVVSQFYGDVDVLSGVQAITPGFSIPLHIGVVLHWGENREYNMGWYETDMIKIISLRKDKTKPLPLNPAEERYPVIDFITSLLDQGND